MALELVQISADISVNPADVSLTVKYKDKVAVRMISTGDEHPVDPKVGEKTGDEIKTRIDAELTVIKI